MSNVGIIFLGGGPRQHTHFWPSYKSCDPGISHDLILVHRNRAHLERVPIEAHSHCDKLTLYDKVINGQDVPCGAFGAYRHVAQKFLDQYEYLAFISDDVILRSNNWLRRSVDLLNAHKRCGFVGTQLFNGNRGEYPHPSHMRAPIWFAKTEALQKINWMMTGDHDGEMRIADQFVAAGYFGAQVGGKITVGYDSLQKDHITQLLERKYFRSTNFRRVFSADEVERFESFMLEAWRLDKSTQTDVIVSPFAHIGQRNLILDIQPLHGLVYDNSLSIAQECVDVEMHHGIGVLR